MNFVCYVNTALKAPKKYGQEDPANIEKESSLLVSMEHANDLLKRGYLTISKAVSITQTWLFEVPDLRAKARIREEVDCTLPTSFEQDAVSLGSSLRRYSHTVKYKVDELASIELNSSISKLIYETILARANSPKTPSATTHKLRFYLIAKDVPQSHFYVTADRYEDPSKLRFEFEYKDYFSYREPFSIPEYFYE